MLYLVIFVRIILQMISVQNINGLKLGDAIYFDQFFTEFPDCCDILSVIKSQKSLRKIAISPCNLKIDPFPFMGKLPFSNT